MGTSATQKTPQRVSHVLPEGTQHPSPPLADRSTPKSRTPTRSQPHPNTPLIGQQPSASNSTPPTALVLHPRRPPRTRPHVARNPTLNQSCARAQGQGQQHKTLKGDKRPHSTVSTTTPQGSTSHLERTPRTQVRQGEHAPATNNQPQTRQTRPRQQGEDRRPRTRTPQTAGPTPCTPSLRTSQQTREMTDANGNEKESMKNHRVARAWPPCITRSLFHTVYVQTPLTCTTNPPSRSAPHSDLHLLPQQKPATQQRPTQHPAKQAQGRTGNPTQRQERTKAHDLTCTHLHPDIPTKSPRSTQVHAQ